MKRDARPGEKLPVKADRCAHESICAGQNPPCLIFVFRTPLWQGRLVTRKIGWPFIVCKDTPQIIERAEVRSQAQYQSNRVHVLLFARITVLGSEVQKNSLVPHMEQFHAEKETHANSKSSPEKFLFEETTFVVLPCLCSKHIKPTSGFLFEFRSPQQSQTGRPKLSWCILTIRLCCVAIHWDFLDGQPRRMFMN